MPAQQSPGRIISPAAGSTVPNGELFIVFQKEESLKWEGLSIKVYLDAMDLSALSKITGNLLTVLATHRLKPGEHRIMVRFSRKGEPPLESQWAFRVAGQKAGLPAGALAEGRPAFTLRSNLHLLSRLTELSGPGQLLRQEPPGLHALNFLGSAQYKKLEIPFRFYITNQERRSLQWRNTYMIGLKGEWFGLFAGDVFPTYQRHILDGSKIRGGRAYLKVRNASLDVTYGSIQRGLEGELRQYDVALGFPPVNLETGAGQFILPGNYRRDVLAAQLRFENKRTTGETVFTFLRGADRPSSIEYGGPPGQNLVLGFGHKTGTKNQVFLLDFGISGSLTTRDTRGGAVTAADIENIYGLEPPVDPSSLEPLIVINASTTPLKNTELPSVSVFANARLNLLRQHLSIQYERAGSSFYSYGAPFLINDRQTLAIGDWMHLWKRRITLSANYRYYTNNLSKEKPLTQKTGYFQGSLRARPHPAWPQLIFSYNDFRRRGEDALSREATLRRNIQTLTAGIHHSFLIGKARQAMNLSYSRNNRLDELKPNGSFFTDALHLRLNSGLPAGFQLTLEYQFLLLSNDTTDFNRQNGYGFWLRYQAPDKKLSISAGARQFRTAETFFTPEANRRLFSGQAEYFIGDGLSFSLQLGRSEYQEALTNSRNYEELWGEAGLRYRWR